MALPKIIDSVNKYLCADRDVMEREGVPGPTIEHVIRLREVYNYWLQYPSKPDKEIVSQLMLRGIKRSMAYDDLKVLKVMLGALQKETKDYMRYRAMQMAMETYERARKAGDLRTMASIVKTYGDIFDLKNDSEKEDIYAQIVPQPFKFTDDPTVAGYKPIPNIREKIRKTLDKYWSDDVEDVDFEDIEFNVDEIFHPQKSAKNEQEGDIS